MFPLFDLDDDAINATLDFSDPRTLCSISMTCRQLRRLTSAAWEKLEKNIPACKREGGRTPRERVLSSYIIHERSSWLADLAQDVGWKNTGGRINSKSTKARHYPILSNEELRQNSYIFCVYICERPHVYPNEESKRTAMMLGVPMEAPIPYINSFVKITEQQCIDLTRDLSIDVAINIEQGLGKFGPFLRKLYGGPGSFSQRNFDESGNFHEFAFNEIGYCLHLQFDITLVAVHRNTLKPGVLLVSDESLDDLGFASTRHKKLRNGSYRAEISQGWTMKMPHQPGAHRSKGWFHGNVLREASFYFEDDSFGLTIGPIKKEVYADYIPYHSDGDY